MGLLFRPQPHHKRIIRPHSIRTNVFLPILKTASADARRC
jgi:hypothetical protein